MKSEKSFFTGSHDPADYFRSWAFNAKYLKENPDYFDPDGIWVFCGSQGQGKTLSAVQTVLELHKAYPKALICSNLELKGVETIPFTDYSQIMELNNGVAGVIFLIDEIQSIWNCMESRDIPQDELATLCMNRKARRVVIGTSQVYGRVAKSIREQYKYVVLCKRVLKYIQINSLVNPCPEGYTKEDDGHFEGELIKTCIFFHSPEAYQAYDTLYKVPRPGREKKILKGGFF